MISIKERAEDVSFIAQCVIKLNSDFHSFRIAGKPSLYVSYGEPLWLVPFTDSAQKTSWDKNFYMFYYPVNSIIFFCHRYGDNPPTDMFYKKVFPFEKGKILNIWDNTYEMNSDTKGQYVKITYKQAALTEAEARKDFQSEYYIDREWVLKSLKLIEVQGCILRWVATMSAKTGMEFRISVDPLGHSYVCEYDGETADFEGKKPDENKVYFSINNTHDYIFSDCFVAMKYHDGSVELLNFGKAKKMPPKEIFKGIKIRKYF